MSRFGGVFWFILVIATGMTNFIVKQQVQGLDEQLARVRRAAVDEQKRIHDLTREWTTLNQPELLASLNNTYLHLVPVSPKQVVTTVDAIAMRPAPPVEPAPEAAAPVADAVPPAGTAPAAAKSAVVPVAVPAPAPARPAAAPLSFIATAHAASEPAAAPPRPAKPSSLDGLFAQVAGNR